MAEQKNKVEIGMGSKGEKPAAGQEVKKTKEPKPEGEVGGRYARENWVICPYCYHNNHIIEETAMRLPYQCWYCSSVFWY
jgi:hypothetical protein